MEFCWLFHFISSTISWANIIFPIVWIYFHCTFNFLLIFYSSSSMSKIVILIITLKFFINWPTALSRVLIDLRSISSLAFALCATTYTDRHWASVLIDLRSISSLAFALCATTYTDRHWASVLIDLTVYFVSGFRHIKLKKHGWKIVQAHFQPCFSFDRGSMPICIWFHVFLVRYLPFLLVRQVLFRWIRCIYDSFLVVCRILWFHVFLLSILEVLRILVLLF